MKYLEHFAVWFMLTACGTEDSTEVTPPRVSVNRPTGSTVQPNGKPASGEVMKAPDGMRSMEAAETSCTSKSCKVQLKVKSRCPVPSIVLVAWELKDKRFYSVSLSTDTSSWQLGDVVTFTPDLQPQVDYVDVENLGYENQSGVFYVCQ